MTEGTIDERALNSLSVAPEELGKGGSRQPRQDAGQDEAIARRLAADPENKEARLDTGLDQSMDASDPPASTQPVHAKDPPASSGYDAAAEAERQQDA